jgi:hypothetical protein
MHIRHLSINILLHAVVYIKVTDSGMGHYGPIFGRRRKFRFQTTTLEPALGSSKPPTQGVRCVIFLAKRRAAPETKDVLSNRRAGALLAFKHVLTVCARVQIQLVTGHVFFTACLSV